MNSTKLSLNEKFEQLTIDLFCHKYLYYELNQPIISDYDYDMLERKWAKLGQELGLLSEDDTMPCIGFDEKHPMAAKGKEKALNKLKWRTK